MVKQKKPLSGVIPPIPTPFDSRGEVHHKALRDNIERWNTHDLSGYVVLGSNGEGVYLSWEEKLLVLDAARDAIPMDKWMIAGTGCESTRATIELTKAAAQAGVDAALVITPHFYGGKMTQEALIRHYWAVADASPVPVLIYNVPKFTHLDLDSKIVARMAEHDNVMGIKDSGGDITKIADMVGLTDPSFRVMAGSGGFFLPALVVGAVGGIMAVANILPDQMLEILRLFKRGLIKEAAELQRKIISLNRAVTTGFGISGLKACLDMLGYYGGPVRAPLLAMGDKEKGQLRALLEDLGCL